MRVILFISVLFICHLASCQNNTGKKYVPWQEMDITIVSNYLKLNGEKFKITSPAADQILQRKFVSGEYVWKNVDLMSLNYDSLSWNKTTGILGLHKDMTAKTVSLDGRYALIEDIPIVPTSIWDFTGIDRTGWEEGKLIKFDAVGNLVVGSTTGSAGIGLGDLSATAPILYNNTTGVFSFSGETDPSIYAWAKASVKPSYSWTEITGRPTLATVATTGNYVDLINKPATFTPSAHTLTSHSDVYIPSTPANKAIVNYSTSGGYYTTSTLQDLGVANNTTQTLTGTTPAWNVQSGVNAKITLSGNTTITLSNVTDGLTGTLYVTNAETSYTLSIAGYTNNIHTSVWEASGQLKVSGGSKKDSFSYKYDGSELFWNGGNDYK